MGERSNLWKDTVDRKFAANLAEKISQVCPDFDKTGYLKAVIDDRLLARELKDRLNLLALHLKVFLPANYKQATTILMKAAPLVGEFSNWVLTSYVEQFGQKHFDRSVATLKELTKYGTGEFSIRQFILEQPEKMMSLFEIWATNKNHHVRRLAAEGTRPRGVWVAHLPMYKRNPKPVLKLLEILKADESLYVRKAVANNLNDISKDHPELVIKTCRRWLKAKNAHTDWIVKHGCRSLIKQGHADVMALFGYDKNTRIEIAKLSLSKKRIPIGDTLSFSVDIKSLEKKNSLPQKLMIDYRVTYLKATGRFSVKVFKLTKTDISSGETIRIDGKHSFADISTRKHTPGEHRIELLINGNLSPYLKFQLTK